MTTDQESQSEENIQVDRMNTDQTSQRNELIVVPAQTFDGND